MTAPTAETANAGSLNQPDDQDRLVIEAPRSRRKRPSSASPAS